jgi:hypothetical protein
MTIAALDPTTRVLLEGLGATREPRGRRADLAELLRKERFPVHDSVLDFEERFGGLIVPAPGIDDWRSKHAFIVLGAYATLRAGFLWRRTADLVPVYRGLHDDLGYLDGRGRGWTEDTIEGPAPICIATDGKRLISFLVANELLFYDPREPVSATRRSARSIVDAHELRSICNTRTFKLWAA